jgi:hypothetical protein
MVQDASSHAIPPRGAYVMRAPQATDALAEPLRAAFGSEVALPSDLAACMAQLRRIRDRT